MSDELKPCPFCGGKPTFVHATSEDIGNGYVCRTLAVISCDHCMFDMTGETDEDAVVTWNARAERTCRIEWRGEIYESEDCIEEDGSYFCTACDQELTGSLAEAWDDYQAWGYKGEQPFRNCPNCGAKIEGEGR